MYRAQARHNKDMSFSIDSNGQKLIIDAKGAEGISPIDTLLASLASCVGVYIRKYSEGAKLNLENFTVRAEGELSNEPPRALKEISVFIDLKGVKLDVRREKALLDFIHNCPVQNTLTGSPEIKVNLTDGN